MNWSERDKQVWQSIKTWREELYEYEANDLEHTYVKWLDYAFESIPEDVQEQFFQRLDGWLFHMHSLIQGSQMQNDARERILVTARAFNQDIQTVEDLHYLTIDQLHYIAEQHAGRHRIYSLLQGGVTGTGGLVALGSDLPAMLVINLRSVQLIAITYGFDVQTPFEMMTSLKVFHAATLPARLRALAWEDLMEDLNKKDSNYFYDGSEQLTDYTWLEGSMKQALKAMAITMFKGKKWSGLPLVSIAIGAGSNYQLSRKITDFAEKYYQYRYLRDKKNEQ
ncbi:EcsC family protein [Bacillus sp. NTK074B]|uniref:EcsC family protein n=1 Tax=Bacillus sp. NTK074B TaxID=2802174 RepID=UPI001A8EAA80|nr:EcsC family protein [Bacillus sp. NTK074B]